ncbi:Uncharacterised protein [uncultured archaeon]|nr:Uncharacterised protein [uncultured archaeon]
MFDILKPSEEGFSHYKHVWTGLRGRNVYQFSDEPSIIVAMDTKRYLTVMPPLLKIEGVEFEAEKRVSFTKEELRKIRNYVNQIYSEKMNVPVRNLTGIQPDAALGISSGYDTMEFDPKRLKARRLLDADIKCFHRLDEEKQVGLLIIENFSDPEDDRRLSENHHYIAAVANLKEPYSWKPEVVNKVSPEVEKIIEILTAE